MSMNTISIIATILGLIATICAFCFLIPEKKRAKLSNPFLVFLHDLFNFKTLWLETIFRFFYAFATITSIICGFFMLFWVEERYYGGGFYGGYHNEWLGYNGLIVMILGPIVIRIIYEFIMMVILLVKNVMSINKKLDGSHSTTANNQNYKAKDATLNYCTHCGNIRNNGDAFCTKCGK